MKRFLLVTAATLALCAPAFADAITLNASVDGTNVASASSPNGTLNIEDQAFGLDFTLNTVTVNSQSDLAATGLLRTNTLDINQIAAGDHQLVIDITATGLIGAAGLQTFLSSFSVTGQDADWTSSEQTLINGVLLADTGLFTGVSDSAFAFDTAAIGNTFSAEAIYTINSVGEGQFSGGIAINAAAVPGPIVGAGLPGLVAGCMGLLGWHRRKRQQLAVA